MAYKDQNTLENGQRVSLKFQKKEGDWKADWMKTTHDRETFSPSFEKSRYSLHSEGERLLSTQ